VEKPATDGNSELIKIPRAVPLHGLNFRDYLLILPNCLPRNRERCRKQLGTVYVLGDFYGFNFRITFYFATYRNDAKQTVFRETEDQAKFHFVSFQETENMQIIVLYNFAEEKTCEGGFYKNTLQNMK
jgi:hypothetical protein